LEYPSSLLTFRLSRVLSIQHIFILHVACLHPVPPVHILYTLSTSCLACPHPVHPVHIMFSLSISCSDRRSTSYSTCPHPVQAIHNPNLICTHLLWQNVPALLDESLRILADIELFQARNDLMFLATKHSTWLTTPTVLAGNNTAGLTH
jgi:hypothetical protein